MSQENAREIAKLLLGLERLASLASAIPSDLLAAWLVYDANMSKTQARKVAESLQRLLRTIERITEAEDEEG